MAKGLCGVHYNQRRRGAELLPITSRPHRRPTRRFTTHYEVGPEASCWPWLGTIEATGYGVLFSNGRFQKGHRYVWEQRVGPIPAGMVLDHECFNTKCVNPKHLRVVTQKQNSEHQKGANKNSKSGIRNVFPTRNGKWIVQIRHNRKLINIGTFEDISEAEIAAKEARAKYFTHAD